MMYIYYFTTNVREQQVMYQLSSDPTAFLTKVSLRIAFQSDKKMRMRNVLPRFTREELM